MSPKPLSQYGTSSQPRPPCPLASSQALFSFFKKAADLGQVAVKPGGLQLELLSEPASRLIAPIGSLMSGLAASGSRLPT